MYVQRQILFMHSTYIKLILIISYGLLGFLMFRELQSISKLVLHQVAKCRLSLKDTLKQGHLCVCTIVKFLDRSIPNLQVVAPCSSKYCCILN
jgi:hypothetical protein